MPKPPKTKYEYSVDKLVGTYESAFDTISRRLMTADLSNLDRAHQVALLSDVGEILGELDADMKTWVEENIKAIAMDGVVNTILSLGVVKTEAQAENLAEFNKLNRNMVKAVIADTQNDLLAVTDRVEKKLRLTVQDVAGQVLRANVTQGNNATKSLARDLTDKLRKELGESAETGIIDVKGRRWKPSTYARVVVNTKMMKAHKEATINEAVSRNALYATISKHSAKDMCSKYEGKVVKLVPDAPGTYPYVDDLPNNEIFHPNCGHVLLPTRHPDKYEANAVYEASKTVAETPKVVEAIKPTKKTYNKEHIQIDNKLTDCKQDILKAVAYEENATLQWYIIDYESDDIFVIDDIDYNHRAYYVYLRANDEEDGELYDEILETFHIADDEDPKVVMRETNKRINAMKRQVKGWLKGDKYDGVSIAKDVPVEY